MQSVMRGCAVVAAVVALSLGAGACTDDGTDSSGAPVVAAPGVGGSAGALGGAGGLTAAPGGAGAGGATAGAGGFTAAGMGGAVLAGMGGMGGAAGMTMAGAGGRAGSGGMTMAGMGGMGGMGGMAGMAGMGGMGGMAGSAPPAADMEALRQSCVDYINMYRATLGRTPYKRATPAQEACSDMGAKKDGDSGQPHSSAGDCAGLGAQNACPGYPVRGTGVAGIETALKGCLDQMWGEGMPPIPVSDCIRDSGGCFQEYGHWINMQSTSSTVVSCGFYKMQNGRYWMNQDFGR